MTANRADRQMKQINCQYLYIRLQQPVRSLPLVFVIFFLTFLYLLHLWQNWLRDFTPNLNNSTDACSTPKKWDSSVQTNHKLKRHHSIHSCGSTKLKHVPLRCIACLYSKDSTSKLVDKGPRIGGQPEPQGSISPREMDPCPVARCKLSCKDRK